MQGPLESPIVVITNGKDDAARSSEDARYYLISPLGIMSFLLLLAVLRPAFATR